MKHLKVGLILLFALLTVCLLPIGARAGQHYESGIVAHANPQTIWNTLQISDGANTITVPMDQYGIFRVGLKPGNYIVTPCCFPQAGPGQPLPNFVSFGNPIAVTVGPRHFAVLKIPNQELTHKGS